MKSKLISIGDEILIGQIVNTNAAFLGDKLFSIGIPVARTVVISDEEEALLQELDDSHKNYDVTIITGGLGLTHDDITKPVLLKYFKDVLVRDEKVLEHVRNIFRSREMKMPPVNEDQALVPKNSKVIWNANGTAPGIWIEKDGKIFIAMPGVPYEMKAMTENILLPELKKRFSGINDKVYLQKTLLTTGLGESSLNELIGNVREMIGESKLAFLPSATGVRLRINTEGRSEEEASQKLSSIEEKLRSRINYLIYGTGNDELEKVVGDILRERRQTLSVAESCTGGMISSKIVGIPGSSDYYAGGVCVYSNLEKIKLLNIKEETLNKYGAVSEDTAKEMAAGVRELMDTDYALSTTGIAGPSGGSELKPVGLVWIGFSDNKKTYALRFNFGHNRSINIQRASQRALEILRRELLNIEIRF